MEFVRAIAHALFLCVLCIAISQNLRGYRKFAGDLECSNMGIDPAKHVLSLVEGAQSTPSSESKD